MPWTLEGELPSAVENLSKENKAQWVGIANALLKQNYSEENAIAIALSEVEPESQTEDTDKAKIVGLFKDFVDKHFGGSSKPHDPNVEVKKSVQEEQRMALFVVLEPDTYDLHNDIYSAEEVEKACNNFNIHCDKANIFHKVETEKVKIAQSFIAPADFTLDTGQEIKKSTWLQWWYFPEDPVGDQLWEGVKSGEINGVSIGASAFVEDEE